ncbi:fatty acid transporter protein-like protein [Leishmania donovani]|uniref:Fatty acid transporter protein-like protein n=1 Tax=Leishmania donovani TaxID=5661 RepID=E9BH47_LEIDO|nr:fatty acid transporter protein-like protein [Leishmania donovani]AYU79268.1 fatty acid transporter protein-like protein [Leishmania donovani]CBZ34573.1 fatty acid transporter protein-like protein [Leishmania donovani]
MSTVNTEGMLEWCLGIQYALRTIGAYLQLGFSLGAVQARHACVPYQLVAYKATCAWRYNIAAPEDGPIYLEGPDAESSTQTSTGQTTKSIAPLCAQASGAVDPVLFLAELLAKFDSLAAITHGEAVDVRLLQRFMHQDILVCKQRHAQIAAGVAVPSKSSHASEESIVFRLSETDATYASVVAAGHPTTITYRDLVILITLLSEAIAWDLLWIHEGQDRQRAQQQSKIADAAPAAPVLPPPPRPTEADCLALMLPNSVEYNAVWMAAARSGPLHTLLDVLYRNSNSEQPKTERGTYRPCRTALLNTNLASNTMLYHAMECSGSVMIVMDVAYVPLLFCSRTSDDADAEGVTSKLELHVPPHVKRIYLWRSTNAAGQPVSSAMTTEMEELLRAFNASAYGDAKSLKAANPSAGDSFVAPPSTPPLDLYDVVKPFLLRAQANPDFTVGEMRHTYLISSPRVRLLMHVILSRPPPSWKSMLALGKPSSAKNGGAEPYATAAGSVKSRKQLQHYKTKMVSILSRLLRRFHHTQPILFIYTSGTSGLPKAARFSHLRFFATGFLSRVLYYRDKIAETVVQQMNEVDYVAAHPAAAGAASAPGLPQQQQQSSSSPHTSLTQLHASGKRETPEEKTDKVGMPSVASSIQYHCPTVPHVFGIESLDFTCRERNIVEAALFALWSASLWCLRLFAAVLGLEYFVASAVEQRLYTPAQLAAIENERRLITLYNCLPMCHTVGSVFCLGHLLHALEEQQHAWAQIRRCAPRHTRLAATVPTVRMIIRTKFSASQFRKDLQRYHVTVVQYIGEVLRYAVLYERSHSPVQAAPPSSGATAETAATTTEMDALAVLNRTAWRVPYAFGNGLRQDIWLECMRRLNIAHPVEFYSSTEGNIFLLNLFGMPGIVGHIPRFPRPIEWLSMQYIPLFPFRVLRFNEETQQVYRDPKTGYCSHCDVGEVGEVVGEVIEGFDVFALRRFDGYHKAHHAAAAADGASIGNSSGGTKAKSTAPADQEEDEAARESKVARHVLWPHQNDCYFLSGDLIRMDRFGFCTFVDRIGDTFRWKGENVSTLEVSNALNSIHTTRVGVQEAVVYGVELPGREGRAGMAMLSLQPRHLRSSSDGCSSTSPSSPSSRLPAPSRPQSLTLAEERRFLQDDLYGFLTGKVRRNGDGTENQAMLPASSIPLFLRMHDLVAGDSQDGDNGVISSEVRLNKHAVAEDATQTSTFKYKKGILINQGYEFDGSSTTCAEVPASAWGNSVTGDDDATTTPYVRVYVLVSNQAALKELALPPVGSKGASGAPHATGYVPLTTATRAILGANMEKCGW